MIEVEFVSSLLLWLAHVCLLLGDFLLNSISVVSTSSITAHYIRLWNVIHFSRDLNYSIVTDCKNVGG